MATICTLSSKEFSICIRTHYISTFWKSFQEKSHKKGTISYPALRRASTKVNQNTDIFLPFWLRTITAKTYYQSTYNPTSMCWMKLHVHLHTIRKSQHINDQIYTRIPIWNKEVKNTTSIKWKICVYFLLTEGYPTYAYF